jgi:hypothetical protein
MPNAAELGRWKSSAERAMSLHQLLTSIRQRLLPMEDWAKTEAPGLLASFIVALAATFLSEHYGASPMLFPLYLLFISFKGQNMNYIDGSLFPENQEKLVITVAVDSIPLGATGKMQKNKLREMFKGLAAVHRIIHRVAKSR